jgi:hypothetical protein
MRICLINYSAMSIIRVAFALALTIAACTTAAAQSILFGTNLDRALRQPVEGTAGGVRVRPANRRCIGCEERPGAVHLIADSPLLTDAWIAGHEYQGTDPAYGDNKGFSSYFAAMQGTVRDEQTGYLVLATAMGRAGITRTGSRFDPDDLVRHVRLHPSGQLEIGFETPTDERPDPMLLVRGAASTEGA